jgi:hypothetical protein
MMAARPVQRLEAEIVVLDRRGFKVVLRPSWAGNTLENLHELEALCRMLHERGFRAERGWPANE